MINNNKQPRNTKNKAGKNITSLLNAPKLDKIMPPYLKDSKGQLNYQSNQLKDSLKDSFLENEVRAQQEVLMEQPMQKDHYYRQSVTLFDLRSSTGSIVESQFQMYPVKNLKKQK